MTGAVYGQALYDLAKEEGRSRALLEQLSVLAECFDGEPDYLKLLAAPGLPKQERCRIVDDSLRGLADGLVLKLMKLMIGKGHIRLFADSVSAFRELYNRDNGILPVQAVTAVPLTDRQRKMLCDSLTRRTGKTIVLENRIDPACLGGVRLDYDGVRIDGTVAHRLEELGRRLRAESGV